MQSNFSAHPNLVETGFVSFNERLKKERFKRTDLGARGLSFGITFLDEALGGIFPNDLVVLGAKSGLGKSQLATLIAQSNVSQGKRVHFFALESEEYEIERRVKYQMIADRFFGMPNRPSIRLNYLDWYYGRFDEPLNDIETEIDRRLDLLPTFHIFYRNGNFGVQEFERIFFRVKDETDLVIIDHLHYFDTEDDNENRAVKDIVKKIRDCALISGKPIILISHVRKADKKLRQLIPDIDDFHGSSDIGKIATKAITIAPSSERPTGNLRKTYFNILKCRPDGARARAVAMLAFNLTKHRYEGNYWLGGLTGDGSTFEAFQPEDIPYWAISAAQVKKTKQENTLL